jgi:hypothetical protein
MRTTLGSVDTLGATIETGELAADAVTGAKIADDAIDSEHYTDGSIDTAHLANDAVTGAKIADDAIDSEHYTDGSIDTAHLAADAVTGAKIADDAIDSEHYTDASIDTAHIGNLQITTALIAADAVTGAKIADDAIDSEHYTDGSIDTAHLAADAVTGAKIADDAIDSEHYADNSVDAAHIFDLARGSLLIGNGSANTAELTVGSDNHVLTVDSSGDIGWEAAASGISTTLTDGNILVGNGSNVATSVNPSGDVDIATDGTFSIASGVIVNADINGSAAIDVSKTALTAGTNISLSTNTLNVDDAFLVNDGNDTTTGTITAAGLTTAGYITLSDDTPADDTGTGIVVTMTALDGLAVGELVHIDANGKLDQAHADAAADMPAIGIALTANASGGDAEVNVLLLGIYRDDSQFDFTPGAPIYVSDTTEGDFIETAPSSDGDFVQRVGVAITADIIYFNPSMDVIEHA